MYTQCNPGQYYSFYLFQNTEENAAVRFLSVPIFYPAGILLSRTLTLKSGALSVRVTSLSKYKNTIRTQGTQSYVSSSFYYCLI
jgi:hypothetical protein